jgi:phage gp36-like protein
MQLFKAKQMAQRQQEETMQQLGVNAEQLKTWVAKHQEVTRANHRSAHVGASTALDTLNYLATRKTQPWLLRTARALINFCSGDAKHKACALAAVERAATDFKARKQSPVAAVKFVEVT